VKNLSFVVGCLLIVAPTDVTAGERASRECSNAERASILARSDQEMPKILEEMREFGKAIQPELSPETVKFFQNRKPGDAIPSSVQADGDKAMKSVHARAVFRIYCNNIKARTEALTPQCVLTGSDVRTRKVLQMVSQLQKIVEQCANEFHAAPSTNRPPAKPGPAQRSLTGSTSGSRPADGAVRDLDSILDQMNSEKSKR
jgi:hypothetical protein